MAKAAQWIDATMEFGSPAGTFPGDDVFTFRWTGRLNDRKWGVNLSSFTSSPHNGTHADAPFHVSDNGSKSEGLPIEVFMGPCEVVDATNAGKDLVPASLAPQLLRSKPSRILFKTREGPVPASFPRGFRGLEPALAKELVEGGVRLLGTDAPSIDRADINGLAAHGIVFGAGAFNLENLDLSAVRPGSYDLFAPPLKIPGLCAAPVRALLRPL